jgi:DNA-binding CsgD family transcriptional regulator
MNLTRPVKQLTLEGEVIGMYPSIYEAARISGITRRTIYNYLEGITKKPKTFK